LIRQLGEAASGREGIPVNVVIDGRIDLPPDVHIAMYRIAQEALNNALKHARASHVTVHLRKLAPLGASANGNTDGIVLTVRDDGRGFDPERVPSDHLGLGIMRERAQSVGATLTVESQPGHGTQITALWEK
jgi:signal transduction histidine kinase